MHRGLAALVAIVISSVCVAGIGSAAEKAAPIRVLMITGDDVAPAHPWREISETTRKGLVETGRFDVKVCEDQDILESASALKHYDVIAFLIYTRTRPEISDQAKTNLLNFVKDGKGFVVQHLASASFAKWDEFGRLCGRKWIMGTSGHGPREVFAAKIVDKTSPITAGLRTSFKVDDELYAKLQGDAPIHVLVESYSDWSKKVEPLAFTQSYGDGRVFHHCFGHDGKALSNPTVVKIIARGVEWAATGKVAPDSKPASP
jgi:type 1 glutamine amidotransferase